ncbi:sigma 54-interacting transcriptional regulator [Chitinophaga sp. NPDC101104]|uniref:sigma 54-interacting transcriptional regulator n=1 Tax=Chitinophaga sp. NPDC101104 TaxID=3390561 RepID=UPI003CFD2E2F
MNEKVLIVEDQFIEANDLRLMLEKAGYRVCGIARSVPQAQELIRQDKPDLVLLDIFLKGRQTGIDLAHELREQHIAFIYLSANSSQDVLTAAKATQPYGFLVKPFRERDVLATLEIARFRHENSLESHLRRETALRKALAQLQSFGGTPEQRLLQAGIALQPYVPFEYLSVSFRKNGEVRHLRDYRRIGFNEYQELGAAELGNITGLPADVLAKMLSAQPWETPALFNGADFTQEQRNVPLMQQLAKSFHLQSSFVYPFTLHNGHTCILHFYSKLPDAFQHPHTEICQRQRDLLAELAESSAGAAPEREGTPAARKAPPAKVFNGIVGNSHLLLKVFDHLSQAAPIDTSILILGESGTGKERIADCIHQLSPRRNKPFVKVNCAALPATLIESELFGHEKGAFTGAMERRTGKFEQAHEGTVFLDEIGEMPVELQAKLLRVLQEREIERLGSRAPIKINVRFIAATNRNLEKEVAEGRFRLDLYYRLNVFPLTLPSLRDRAEDIPLLVQHFIDLFNSKTGKRIQGVTDKVMAQLQQYHWPGNIRELEHMIERGMLLNRGPLIEEIMLPEGPRPAEPVQNTTSILPDSRVKTIHENERDHILSVLKKCNGRVWGAGGAAELLQIPPTTLHSKMKKLGIRKEHLS